jgi:hypothetical protein
MTRFTFDVDAALASIRDKHSNPQECRDKIQAIVQGKSPNVAVVANVAVRHPSTTILNSPIGTESGVGVYLTATSATTATTPESYDDALERLLASPPHPELVPADRLDLFAIDAQRFVAAWGSQALALGWTVDDLFGLDPVAPLARYDRMGLCWLLKGRERVIALTATQARLSNGLSFTKRQP